MINIHECNLGPSYGLKCVAMIIPESDLIPICNATDLEPGRYAIHKCQYTGDFTVYERGTKKDKQYMYYTKDVTVYGRDKVYLYDEAPFIHKNERQEYSVKSLYNNEMRIRKKREKELQKQLNKVNKKRGSR